MTEKNISKSNSEFWNELCGSQLARSIGVTDDSPASLKKFDDWYFDFYPYLFDHILFDELTGKDVLEVGLGYGTVSQRLAETGAKYQGLDIAEGPVNMANHRFQQMQLQGMAIQGSILEPPHKSRSFDAIVAIGCLHHTGNLKLAIDSCWNLLRPRGTLIFMVYYAYSYRRWHTSSMITAKYMAKELFGYRGVVGSDSVKERAKYDTNTKGVSAPHTDWISKRSLKYLCNDFSDFTARIENIDQQFPLLERSRQHLLKTRWPQVVGLDLYAVVTK